MGIFDDIKTHAQSLADQDGDGRLSAADLEALKDGNNDEKIEALKQKADANEDGKIDLADLKGVAKDLFNK
ncbi:EF-hand domain-containing protein [Candidatus Saccharibacteria bacterium]|nr:EF-hand domain-containing protein [Candidatus Saccharibacteria bacterium]